MDPKYAHCPSVIFHSGVLDYFYCAVSPGLGRGISVATSRQVRQQTVESP